LVWGYCHHWWVQC